MCVCVHGQGELGVDVRVCAPAGRQRGVYGQAEACVCICTHTCMDACVCVCLSVCLCVYACTYACMHLYVCCHQIHTGALIEASRALIGSLAMHTHTSATQSTHASTSATYTRACRSCRSSGTSWPTACAGLSATTSRCDARRGTSVACVQELSLWRHICYTCCVRAGGRRQEDGARRGTGRRLGRRGCNGSPGGANDE